MRDAPVDPLPRRPGLDGIRALAVSAVLLYHAGVTWAGGGFLGVDVFFVLSGFLITSLLLDEHRRTGRIDLRAFWGARARRLLPALGVLLVTILWILPWAGIRWSRTVSGDAWATAAYVANWRFIASGQSYADQAAGLSPLLHTWSLAIEEQWYVALPLVLVVVLRLRHRVRVLAAILTAGTAISATLAWRLHAPGADISRAYYGTDTRVQALLVGALAAILTGRYVWRGGLPGAWAGWRPAFERLPWLALPGLIGLLALVARLTPESTGLYRGGFLAVALCSAAFVVGVAASDPSARGVTSIPVRLLSLPPVTGLGVISYGVYLWHWPVILVLTPTRTGWGGQGLLAARIAVTLALACASYLLIERPIRRRVWRRIGHGRPELLRRWVPASAGAACALVLAALTFPGAAAPVAADSLTALAATAAHARAALTTPSPGAAAASTPPATPGPTSATSHSIVLVGDSQALSLYAAVKDSPGQGVTLQLAMRLGCGVAPYTAIAAGVALYPEQPLCGDWAKSRESEIAAAHADTGVLFAGTWEQYDRLVDGHDVAYTSPQWQSLTTAAYREVLTEMSRHVQHLAVALDHCHGAPEVDVPVQTLFQWGRYPPVVNDPRRIAAVNHALIAAAAAFPQVTVIDPGAYLCAHGYTAKLDGVQLRTDGVHLTTGGGRLLWAWMRPRLLAGING